MITEAYQLAIEPDHIMDIVRAAQVTGLIFKLLPNSAPQDREEAAIAMRDNFAQRVRIDNASANTPDMWESAARAHQKAGGYIIRLSGSDLSAKSANKEAFDVALRRERAVTKKELALQARSA